MATLKQGPLFPSLHLGRPGCHSNHGSTPLPPTCRRASIFPVWVSLFSGLEQPRCHLTHARWGLPERRSEGDHSWGGVAAESSMATVKVGGPRRGKSEDPAPSKPSRVTVACDMKMGFRGGLGNQQAGGAVWLCLLTLPF